MFVKSAGQIHTHQLHMKHLKKNISPSLKTWNSHPPLKLPCFLNQLLKFLSFETFQPFSMKHFLNPPFQNCSGFKTPRLWGCMGVMMGRNMLCKFFVASAPQNTNRAIKSDQAAKHGGLTSENAGCAKS